MRTTNRKHYRPYIRRANGSETANGFRESIRLAFYQSLGRPFYVMVQHGFPNSVCMVGRSKREILHSIVGIALGKLHPRQWAKAVQKNSRGW